jgi:hypothetical protein
MSGFLFGGSALALDISLLNGTGGVRKNGDVVAVALEDIGGDAATGYEAALPAVSASGVGNFALCGVVVAPEGHEYAEEDSMNVRVMGAANARVTGNVSKYSPLKWADNSDQFGPTSLPDLSNAATVINAATDIKAIALETNASASDSLMKVWLRGFPL